MGGCSFSIHNIAYWAAMFKENLEVDIACILPAIHKMCSINRREDK